MRSTTSPPPPPRPTTCTIRSKLSRNSINQSINQPDFRFCIGVLLINRKRIFKLFKVITLITQKNKNGLHKVVEKICFKPVLTRLVPLLIELCACSDQHCGYGQHARAGQTDQSKDSHRFYQRGIVCLKII